MCARARASALVSVSNYTCIITQPVILNVVFRDKPPKAVEGAGGRGERPGWVGGWGGCISVPLLLSLLDCGHSLEELKKGRHQLADATG